MPPVFKFFGSASVVTSADRVEFNFHLSSAVLFFLRRDRWARVDGRWSTPPVEQPHEPPAGNCDTNLNVAPAGGPSAEDIISLGCSASLGRALSVIYRITLLSAHQLPGETLSSVYWALTIFNEIPLVRWSMATWRNKRKRISRPQRYPMPIGITDLINLSSSPSPRDALSMTGSAASSRSQTRRFLGSAMVLLIAPPKSPPCVCRCTSCRFSKPPARLPLSFWPPHVSLLGHRLRLPSSPRISA